MSTHKILVIRLSSLGDVVLTAPVYERLRATWPDATISVLVKPAYVSALEGNPHISTIIPFESIKKTIAIIRAERFTHLLDLHANIRSKIISSLSRIPNVSVYQKNAWARRLFVFFRKNSPELQKHTTQRYLEALNPWTANAEPHRIVIIQTAFLGDSVLTIPLAREVKSRWPDCHLSIATLKPMAPLFKDCGWIDDVLVDEKKGLLNKTLGAWKRAKALQKMNFDLALIPHRSLRSALIAWMAKIPQRIGFENSAGRFLLTQAVPFPWSTHDLERNLSLLSVFTPKPASNLQAAYLYADTDSLKSVLSRLEKETSSKSAELIGIHPGSVWPTKRWPARRFQSLCLRLSNAGYLPILVGGSQDKDLCATIANGSSTLNWAGSTSLGELKALMSRMSLFITNDSGPMHIATGLGIPTLAIFGATTRELGFFPYGPRHRVVEKNLACRPCGLHGRKKCPRGHFLCMEMIAVEEVWKASQEMLGTCGVSPAS